MEEPAVKSATPDISSALGKVLRSTRSVVAERRKPCVPLFVPRLGTLKLISRLRPLLRRVLRASRLSSRL